MPFWLKNDEGQMVEIDHTIVDKMLPGFRGSKHPDPQYWYGEFLPMVRKRDGYRCVACNGKICLDGHHRTYDNLGHEELGDVYLFCRSCHDKLHQKPSLPQAQPPFAGELSFEFGTWRWTKEVDSDVAYAEVVIYDHISRETLVEFAREEAGTWWIMDADSIRDSVKRFGRNLRWAWSQPHERGVWVSECPLTGVSQVGLNIFAAGEYYTFAAASRLWPSFWLNQYRGVPDLLICEDSQ